MYYIKPNGIRCLKLQCTADLYHGLHNSFQFLPVGVRIRESSRADDIPYGSYFIFKASYNRAIFSSVDLCTPSSPVKRISIASPSSVTLERTPLGQLWRSKSSILVKMSIGPHSIAHGGDCSTSKNKYFFFKSDIFSKVLHLIYKNESIDSSLIFYCFGYWKPGFNIDLLQSLEFKDRLFMRRQTTLCDEVIFKTLAEVLYLTTELPPWLKLQPTRAISSAKRCSCLLAQPIADHVRVDFDTCRRIRNTC